MKHARLLVSLLALAACDGPPPPAQLKGQVGARERSLAVVAVVAPAQGGVVGGGETASVSVPAGAVQKDVSIALAEVDAESSEDADVLGKAWSFTVDGADAYRFEKPVTLSLPFDPSLKQGDEPVGLSVWKDGGWDPVPGAREEGQRVKAEVDHFSRYAPTQSKKKKGTKPPKRPATLADAERWYCRVAITIRGAGQRSRDGDTRSYTISRVAEAEFVIVATPGMAGANEALEEMARRGYQLPPDAQANMQKALAQRMWTTQHDRKKRTEEDETRYSLRVADRSDSDVEEWGEGGPTGEHEVTHASVTGGDSGLSKTAEHILHVDLDKGTYSLGVSQLIAGTLTWVESGTDQPEQKHTTPAGFAWALRDEPFPKDAALISGNKQIKRKELHNFIPGLNKEFDFGSLSGRITWTLSPVPFEEVELVLDPKGYETWLPRGGPDEGTKGDKPLQVTARLQLPGGGTPGKAKLERLVVRLTERSHVPGVCLNRPLQGGGTTPDLKLACRESGATIEDDGERLTRKGSFGPTEFEVECYDWGAWGTLTAEGRLEDGRPVYATLAGNPAEEEVRLPKRDEGSKVADAWKKEMKAQGLADTDDAEPQEGNPNKGDGLSLWEEYRGLIAKGKHTRDGQPLDPRKKDLVVRNEIAQEKAAVERGFRILEKAARIHVVELKKEELPTETRLVNTNTQGDLTVCPQHGLILYDRPTEGGGAGETAYQGPSPGSYAEIIVWIQGHLDNGQGSEIPVTVAHELAHGTGIRHHGVDDARDNYPELSDKAKVFDVNKNPLETRSLKIEVGKELRPGVVGEPGNAASGNIRCVMSYYKTFDWCRAEDGFYRVPATSLTQDQLCTDGKGSPGNLFGDCRDGKGNCTSQMKIKDK